MRKIATALIASALSFAMAPAFAQDDDAPRMTTTGNVMVSSGGEYVSAVDGQIVIPGQSFMVESGSAATITYDDDCVMSYVHPGTYTVQEDCDPAAVAYIPAGSTGLMTGNVAAIGIVAGVVALSAAGLEAMGEDGDTVPPLSP